MPEFKSLFAGFLLLLSGCTSPKPEDYKDQQPAIHLKQLLNGTFDAWGMIQQPNGKVIKFMKAELTAGWVGDDGTLKEHFRFSDGKEQRREWKIRRLDDHHYTATAADAVGEAKIEVYGNAMRWDYTLHVPVDGKDYVFTFDDWIFMADESTLLNRAKMKKFGFTVAEMTIFFKKR